MSWTIENLDEANQQTLKDALKKAADADILLFCASNDQGRLTDVPYPAKLDDRTFKIGAATVLGTASPETQTSVSFIAPGWSDEVSEKQTMNGGNLDSEKPLFGSSIATARCAGLAALILQCLTLTYPNAPKTAIRTRDNMKEMFMRLVGEGKEGDYRYLRVWDVFEAAKSKAAEIGTNEEKYIIDAAAREFGKKVKWVDFESTSQPRAAAIKEQQTVDTDKPRTLNGVRSQRRLPLAPRKPKPSRPMGD